MTRPDPGLQQQATLRSALRVAGLQTGAAVSWGRMFGMQVVP